MLYDVRELEKCQKGIQDLVSVLAVLERRANHVKGLCHVSHTEEEHRVSAPSDTVGPVGLDHQAHAHAMSPSKVLEVVHGCLEHEKFLHAIW